MSDFNGPETTPNVGIRGNPTPLKSTSREVSVANPGNTPNFAASLIDFSKTPTMLGEIGSRIMMSSSAALATKYGQELGKEPRGNLLPDITDFDKSVTESYKQQSQVTLGNRANELLIGAEEQMSKVNKLNPGLIASYKQNLEKGFKDILDLAPDDLKPQLEVQLTNKLQNTVHQYNERMITANKAEIASEAVVWRKHQNDYVSNLVKDAKTPKEFENAKQSYNDLISNINNSNLSPSEKDTALTSAKLNYESSISINKLMDARTRGKEDEYLSSIADKKIQGLSWSESEQVRDNTVKYISAVETAENRDQNLIMSQASLDMANQSFNESSLAKLREELRPENFNRIATQWAVQQHKNNNELVKLQNIISNPSNAISYEGLTTKQINSGFDLLARNEMQKSMIDKKPITQSEAEFRAASSMNTIVPKFIDGLNRKMVNGNPQQVLEGYETYERLHELDGNKVLGLNQKSLAVATLFKNFLTSNPGANPDQISDALFKAKNAVLNKTEAQIDTNNKFYSKYINSVAKDPQSRLSNALAISGLTSGKNIENASAFQNDIYSRMQSYMSLTDNDVETSKEMVQADVAKIWGESRINGESKITKLGVEKAINLPLNSAPLIQDDIIDQLIPQLENDKKLYDMGAAPSYWRVKEGRINYNQYAKAKLAIYEKGFSDPDYATNKQLIKKYESSEPIIIEQVHKNGIKEWHLNVQSSPYISRSAKDNKVYGYNIGLKDPKSGMPGNLFGYYGATHSIPTYQPDESKIRNNYLGIAHDTGLSPEEYINRQKNQIPENIGEYRQKLLTGKINR
jgi:hypothetical protein